MATRNLILVDPPHRDSLKPLSWARPVSSIRIGILTIADKWERALDAAISWSVPNYLQSKFPARVENENFLVQGHLLPGQDLRYIISKLGLGEVLVCREQWVAARLSESQTREFLQNGEWKQFRQQELESQWVRGIRNLWEIFQWNDLELRSDFEILTSGRQSAPADPSNRIFGDRFFMEEGAKVMASTINTHTGPVYIGFQSEIMEGCMIRGALAL
ncbi:MAG TPA: putative sugar nucleotidyl transferase, partial [Saprospiraceae bacterium]|nr:putative sugar nucleotidyl transferase [Saprospiraceae bacterium]